MNHRREIDGLRALAVLPVILFHAGFAAFSGGFVGVDVFFVISGYLITGIILAEREAGRFSLLRFYERRARRILPALFVVVAATLMVAWCWLMPGHMKALSTSVLAVCGYASNVLFASESGYFDTAAELKPLLHTWSLGVEEQFYLLCPPLILLAWRLGRGGLVVVLGLVALASLAWAQWAVQHQPAGAFFLLPARAWELLVGSLLACHAARAQPATWPHWVQQGGSLLGLGLLLGAMAAFDAHTPFPGLYALVPTLGTALLIALATPHTLVGQWLGQRWLVGLGWISYSAYLWHQPLFVLARHRSLHEPGPAVFGGLTVATLALAYLTWRWVEQPWRDRARLGSQAVWAMTVLGSLVLAGIGWAGHHTRGHFWRASLQARMQQVEHKVRPNLGLGAHCEGRFTLSAHCRTSDRPQVLVWGDSHAMHLVPGLLASQPDLRLVQMTISSCGPFLGLAPVNPRHPVAWARQCMQANDQVLAYLRQTPSITHVLMSSMFTQYVEPGARLLLRDGRLLAPSPDQAVLLAHVRQTLAAVRSLGKTAVLFSPPPRVGENLGLCAAKASFFAQDAAACDFELSRADGFQHTVRAVLQQLDVQHPVVWLSDGLCPQGHCRAVVGQTFVYRDEGHLSHEGSAWLGTQMGFAQRLKGVPRAGARAVD